MKSQNIALFFGICILIALTLVGLAWACRVDAATAEKKSAPGVGRSFNNLRHLYEFDHRGHTYLYTSDFILHAEGCACKAVPE